MNWIKLLNRFRYFLLVVFGCLYIVKRFNWVENSQIGKDLTLYDLTSLLVAAYFVVYLIQSRMEVHQKDKEIEALKSQLKID